MLDLFVSHFRESSQDCSEVIQKEQFQMRLLKPYTQECSRHIYNLSKIIIIVSKEMATFVAAWYVGWATDGQKKTQRLCRKAGRQQPLSSKAIDFLKLS